MEATKRTPLIELLERVPRDAVLVVEHDQFSSSSHPVGRLCHEAAAALEAAQAELDAMREALKDADNELDWLDERDALAAEVERLRRGPHPTITHCANCGRELLDNELKEWIERGRTEEEKAAALKWLEDMRKEMSNSWELWRRR